MSDQTTVPLTIVSWNVNSIRIRMPQLMQWLALRQPDVVCLQELKVEDSAFPLLELRSEGWHVAFAGQKAYNGVAILSRTPITDVAVGLDDGVDDPQVRLIAGTVRGVRVVSLYLPNGNEPDSDKYVYKQQWLQRFVAWLQRQTTPDQLLAVLGDFNIAPELRDVRTLADWQGSVLYNPLMHQHFGRILDCGLRDAFRRVCPDPGVYSWWDYRAGAFARDDGLRIDHVLATEPLARLAAVGFVDRVTRTWDKPSDHAPIGVTFALPA
jgi:exodeoxyribonuclease-3